MKIEKLKKIEGKQTIDTISEKLDITYNSASNLISKLRKEGYLTTIGGRDQKRIYTISLKKKTDLDKGMFDILNEKTPVKIYPPFLHKTHGNYRIEDAIIDLIKLDDIRILTGVIYLFNYIKDWTYLRKRSVDIEGKLGALYDFARSIRKTKKMPDTIRKALLRRKPKKLQYWIHKKEPDEIAKKWNITVPLRGEDFDRY